MVLNDLANLALESAKMNYLDTSVEFLRGLQKLGKEKVAEMNKVKGYVDSLKKEIVGPHNDMLRKRKKKAGVDFRSKSVLILLYVQREPYNCVINM